MAEAQTFGKYTLMRKLAAGGMGEVYLAKQQGFEGFEKFLVIKRILSHHTDNPDYVDMFFAEARLAAKMSHSNIVQIYEMGEIEGAYFIAMEYVNGKSMKDIIDAARAKGQKLEPAHIADMVQRLASGLGYAHNLTDMNGNLLNIIHRDINPHNALVSYGGEVKVIDFGIAKSDSNEHKTETGTIKGKFVYMSPEQSAAEKIDKRSDIFSIGIVLYEMLAGENPFQKPNIVLSLDAIQRFNPPPPSSIDPAFAPFDPIIAKALAKKADERYQDCAEIVTDLLRLMGSGEIPKATKSLNKLMQDLFKEQIEKEQRFIQEFVNLKGSSNNTSTSVKPRPQTQSLRADIAPVAEPEPEPTPAPMQLEALNSNGMQSTGMRTSGAAMRRRQRRNSVYVILGVIALATLGVVAALLIVVLPPSKTVEQPTQQIDLSDPPSNNDKPPPVVGQPTVPPTTTPAPNTVPPVVVAQPPPQDNGRDKDKDRREKDRDKNRKDKDKREKDRDPPKAEVKGNESPKVVVVQDNTPTPKQPEVKKAQVIDDPPPQQTKITGSFTVLSSPAAPVFREGSRLSSGQGPTKVELNKQTGTIKVGDATTPFQVTFVYRLSSDHSVDVQIDSQPWSIVKKDGLSLGKTPRPWSPSDGVKRYEFVGPGKEPMSITIRFNP